MRAVSPGFVVRVVAVVDDRTEYAKYLIAKRKTQGLRTPEANWLANYQRKRLRIVK